VQYRAPAECVRQREILKSTTPATRSRTRVTRRLLGSSTELARQSRNRLRPWSSRSRTRAGFLQHREERGDATWKITHRELDYRITATLRPASWQPPMPSGHTRPRKRRPRHGSHSRGRTMCRAPSGAAGEDREGRGAGEAARKRGRGACGMHDFIALASDSSQGLLLHQERHSVSENGSSRTTAVEWHADNGTIPSYPPQDLRQQE